MIRAVTFLVLLLSASAVAQEPPAENTPDTAAPATPASQSGDGAEADSADDEEFGADDLIPAGVEEQAPPPAPDPFADPEEEFTPEDEISEDFPVPLPADI